MEDSAEQFKINREQISAALVDSTRTIGQLSAEDLSFQRSLDPTIGRALDKQSSRLLRFAQTLLQKAVAGSHLDLPSLRDPDDVENNWQGIVDVVDLLLERADTALDEYTGLVKKLAPENGEQANKPRPPLNAKHRHANTFRDLELPKPQLQFHEKPNNKGTAPFKPLLKSKPHALVPLQESLATVEDDNGVLKYKHPYEEEILSYDFPEPVYHRSEPTMYKPFESSTATYVDSPEELRSMLEVLKQAKEIAVDLEHHDTRTYVGIVCLMQISTREQDWIIDTLVPWREDLQILNEVFADPRILKVFHGAFMDIIWLQRDLGLYVVGLFDTFHAARTLGFPQASLAALLSQYVHFDADKQYQMADWRIRPLPDEMLRYARSDTHFLLVLEKSKETALQTYERFVYDEASGRGLGGWYNLLRKTSSRYSKEQFAVFKALHQWRDQLARTLDDSPNYTMPYRVLCALAQTMPTEMTGFLNTAQPITPAVRARTSELVALIRDAKAAGVHGPDASTIFSTSSGAASRPSDRAAPCAPTGLTSQLADTHESTLLVPVRSGRSRFWGLTLGSSSGEAQQSSPGTDEEVRLALPLPPLTAEIFQDTRHGTLSKPAANTPTTTGPGARAEHAFVRDRPKRASVDDGVFTVKQLGGSRKRKADLDDRPTAARSSADDDLALPEDVVTGPPDHPTEEVVQPRALAKAARKAQRRANKLHARRAGQDAALSNDRTAAEMDQRSDAPRAPVSAGAGQPFDYDQAESVLRAKPAEPGAMARSKFIDPYSKAMQAPAGARKARQERPGKTMTYKV
ncbi:MAG: exosome nuclease subunit [Phylliscum demangeonii]|nr:MAG: exosome nuclease subunit [Phylliscum demangeonii]